MNDLVLEGFVRDFSEARGLSHLKQDEIFEAFVASPFFGNTTSPTLPIWKTAFSLVGAEMGAWTPSPS